MFFVEKDYKTDIIVPRIFFEQIIPLSHPGMVEVYLYGFFLSTEDNNEKVDNNFLAAKLNMSIDKIKEAWDFYEACGIIKKHKEEGSDDYSIEFLDLAKKSTKKKKKKNQLSTEELILLSKNQDHKKMLDQIEESIGTFLVPEDIRKIESFISEYNMPKALIVEAFSFCVEKKKSRTARMALGVARTWYLEGIRSVEDLDIYNQRKGNRYNEYKKILTFLGEYRTATKAEEELIDKWLDEYKFSLEVIEEACKRTTSIKSPNLKYIDGILKNWDGESEKLNIKQNLQGIRKDPTIFRVSILEAIGHKGKSLSPKELEYMKALYDSFSLEDSLMGVEGLSTLGKEKNIENLYSLLKEPCRKSDKPITKLPSENDSRIGIKQLEDVMSKKSPKTGKAQKTEEEKTKNNIEIEKLLLEKRKKWKEEVLDGQKT